jgi:SAM-dependent methyltransferase
MPRVTVEGMEAYWDLRAGEDPFFYVDTRQALGAPDEEAFWRAGEEVVDHLLESFGLSLRPTEVVVEIGCGIGRLTRALAHRVGSVDALDVSQTMLDHARKHNPELGNVRWIHGDGSTLAPLTGASYDACVSFVVFQHLPTPELTYGYVREIGRVLRPGGWGVFQVSNDPRVHQPPTGWPRLKQRLLSLTRRGPRDQTNRAWLGSAVQIDELHRAAQDGGLAIERIDGQGKQFCLVMVRRAGSAAP